VLERGLKLGLRLRLVTVLLSLSLSLSLSLRRCLLRRFRYGKPIARE
jgi:hypothetical protein